MSIIETLRGKLRLYKPKQEDLAQLSRNKQIAVDNLSQQAATVLTPTLDNIITAYAGGRGKKLDIFRDYESGTVQLGVEWETDEVNFLGTPKQFNGRSLVDGPNTIKPVARVTWKRLGFRLRLGGTAELVTANDTAVRLNIKDKNWQEKISPRIRELVTNSDACNEVRNEYFDDYLNRKRVERGEEPIDHEARRKQWKQFKRQETGRKPNTSRRTFFGSGQGEGT